MALFVILNIVVVIITLVIDLHRHQYTTMRFSSVLLAIAINSFLNQIVLGKVTFISMAAMWMFIVWAILQYYIDRYYTPFYIRNQKFLIAIFTVMLSISLVITYQIGDQSYYMSIPYVAPAIYLFGCILIFSSTFQSPHFLKFYQSIKVRNPLWIGTIFIVVGLITLTILTPFWYVLLLIHLGFLIVIGLEKLYKL